MFWVDTLSEDYKYCTCQSAWKSMSVVYANVYKNLLEIYIAPEDGTRCCVFKQKKSGSLSPRYLEFNFDKWEHVKIEVVGGEITLLGVSDDEGERHKACIRFTSGCSFGNEED